MAGFEVTIEGTADDWHSSLPAEDTQAADTRLANTPQMGYTLATKSDEKEPEAHDGMPSCDLHI
jgi:hypothetical protein